MGEFEASFLTVEEGIEHIKGQAFRLIQERDEARQDRDRLREWEHRTVPGRCPNGCGQTLFVAGGGHVTCSWAACPDPGAADTLLAGADSKEGGPDAIRAAYEQEIARLKREVREANARGDRYRDTAVEEHGRRQEIQGRLETAQGARRRFAETIGHLRQLHAHVFRSTPVRDDTRAAHFALEEMRLVLNGSLAADRLDLG